MMNKDPDKGTLWKGRLLIQVKAEKTEKPILKIRNIEDEQVVEDAQKNFNLKSYAINCQVIAGICLPDDEEYQITLSIAEENFSTVQAPVHAKDSTYCRWNENVTEEKKEIKLPYQNINDIGSIFIYLCKKRKIRDKFKAITYYRGHVTDFSEPNAAV